jgi:hypothetical protein
LGIGSKGSGFFSFKLQLSNTDRNPVKVFQ